MTLIPAAPSGVLGFSFPNPFNLLGDLLSPLIGIGADLAGSLVESVIGDLAGAVIGALADLAFSILLFFWTAAEPELDSPWFYGADAPYHRMVLLAMPLFVAFLLVGVIHGVLRGDRAGLMRMAFVRLPVSILAMSLAVVLTDVLLDVTDEMSLFLLADFRDDVTEVGRVLGTLALAGSLVHKLLLLVFALVGLLAALVVVIELFVRAALIYLVAAFCPLILAAGIWEPMRGGVRKLGELAFALIISKLGIAAALAVCSAALVSLAPATDEPPTAIPTPEQAALQAQQSTAQSVGVLVSAITMFCVAAFMPFILFRLLPIAEGASVAHGVRGAPFRGAHLGASAATMAMNNPATSALRSRRGGTGGSGSKDAGASSGGAASGASGAIAGATVEAGRKTAKAAKERAQGAAQRQSSESGGRRPAQGRPAGANTRRGTSAAPPQSRRSTSATEDPARGASRRGSPPGDDSQGLAGSPTSKSAAQPSRESPRPKRSPSPASRPTSRRRPPSSADLPNTPKPDGPGGAGR